ncbi:hypothetical protein [Actimicrobium antarcticum]|uniref:hypothetical protein n=1 Tax=Actimicrobium antarcticum TaxID=1051899 RepID=UPI0031D58D9B
MTTLAMITTTKQSKIDATSHSDAGEMRDAPGNLTLDQYCASALHRIAQPESIRTLFGSEFRPVSIRQPRCRFQQ